MNNMKQGILELSIQLTRRLLDYLHACLLQHIVNQCKHNGVLDVGQFYSNVGFHVAYGNLPQSVVEELSEDEEEE